MYNHCFHSRKLFDKKTLHTTICLWSDKYEPRRVIIKLLMNFWQSLFWYWGLIPRAAKTYQISYEQLRYLTCEMINFECSDRHLNWEWLLTESNSPRLVKCIIIVSTPSSYLTKKHCNAYNNLFMKWRVWTKTSNHKSDDHYFGIGAL
jgi:hypothetical protein